TGAAPVPSISVPARTMVMTDSFQEQRREYSASSVAFRAIDDVQERRAREKAPEVLGEEVRALVVVARDEPGDVRRQDQIRMVERVQRVTGGRWLLREDVDRGARDPPLRQRARERRFVHAATTAHVDEV